MLDHIASQIVSDAIGVPGRAGCQREAKVVEALRARVIPAASVSVLAVGIADLRRQVAGWV
jgi:hypothetical protein